MEKEIKKIYPPESAGRRMIENIPTCLPDDKVFDVKRKLLEKAAEFETLNYIYVMNEEGKLIGVFSLKELLQKPDETKVEDFMIREIIKAHPYTDQERVAILALKHNLKAIPVIGKDNKFLGVVTSDTILDILHSEHAEDVLRSAGVHNGVYFPSRIMKVPIGILAKTRIPWLIFGLLGGIFAAQITTFFEAPLKSHFILAAFIPLMVYMADAVGAQAQTLFIRNLAIDYGLNIKKYFLREIKVSFLIALVLGIILSLISLFWAAFPLIGFILGLSLFLTVIFASLIAILIPWLLNNFKEDPALGSGPFATIIRDILSLVVYFSIAAVLLKFFK